MEKVITTYFTTVQECPEKEFKVEILEDGLIKKVAVNGKIYEVDYNQGGDSIHSMIIGHHSHGLQISIQGTHSYEVMNRQHSYRIGIMNELDRINSASDKDSALGRQVLTAPMSGVILKMFVKPGEEVKRGAPLCILMAMKMENELCAETDGVVTELFAKEGGKVNTGGKILVLDAK